MDPDGVLLTSFGPSESRPKGFSRMVKGRGNFPFQHMIVVSVGLIVTIYLTVSSLLVLQLTNIVDLLLRGSTTLNRALQQKGGGAYA